MSDSRPIGIFDSGLGGLTVLNAIKKVAFILFGFEVDTVFKDLFAESILDNTEKVFDVIVSATVFGKS